MATARKFETVEEANEKKANRDPITGQPGSHPVATGVGAAIGAAAGVASGAFMGATAGAGLGPIGAVVGAVAGGIAGGGIGHGIGEDLYPTQLAWWKESYFLRPYINKELDFDEYAPAYKVGMKAAVENKDRSFDDLEPSLRNNWNMARGKSSLTWDEAREAARDAHERMLRTEGSRF